MFAWPFRSGKIAGLLAGLVLALLAASAAVSGQTAGPTILTVSGLDPALHPGGAVSFDLAALQTLPQETIATTSVWTDGLHSFTGVPLSALGSFLHLTDVTLRMIALNDYSIEMPLAESSAEAPILAYQMDGQPMPVRDKGPIWIIYPYDKGAEFRTDTVYSRSVWQLDRIEVLR